MTEDERPDPGADVMAAWAEFGRHFAAVARQLGEILPVLDRLAESDLVRDVERIKARGAGPAQPPAGARAYRRGRGRR